MPKLRLIGDVHGFYDAYIPIAEEADYSIQVGDMGFSYAPLSSMDYKHHKFIGGNHDNYDEYYEKYSASNWLGSETPMLKGMWNLCDFGMTNHGGLDFFFVRGGFSIDWRMRLNAYLRGGMKTYWDNEELCLEDMEACLAEYKKTKPDFVISHEAPRSITKRVGNNDILKTLGYNPETFSTRTGELLEAMFQAHQPKTWVFGHYHVEFDEVINGTRFVCLPELGHLDLEV